MTDILSDDERDGEGQLPVPEFLEFVKHLRPGKTRLRRNCDLLATFTNMSPDSANRVRVTVGTTLVVDVVLAPGASAVPVVCARVGLPMVKVQYRDVFVECERAVDVVCEHVPLETRRLLAMTEPLVAGGMAFHRGEVRPVRDVDDVSVSEAVADRVAADRARAATCV